MADLLVTGGTGMVGQAIQRSLPEGVVAVFVSSRQFDLRKPPEARKMMRTFKPKCVIHLAAKVGGVKANSEQVADFFNENILINTNVLMAAHKYNVNNVVSLLSTCVYPDAKWVTYPLTETQLHEGPPHNSNFGYAYAKRMVEVQSRAFRQQYGRNFTTAIPNNIYGPDDNFDLEDGHVLPAIVRKIYEAKTLGKQAVFWGNGAALREFTYSDDIAQCLLKMAGILADEVYNSEIPCNIGTAEEVSIREAVEMVAKILEYNGDIFWDETKPSGQHRKPSRGGRVLHEYTPLREGLKLTCEWFKENYPDVRGVK